MAEYINRKILVDLVLSKLKFMGDARIMNQNDEKVLSEIDGYEKAINAVHELILDKDLIEDVQPAPKWISVKERLPEAVEKNADGKITFSDFVLVYLVCDDGFTYITNDKCIVDSKLWLHEIPDKDCKVTHWMPLPEPPKNDDAED